ncbi:glycine zipper family protein [Vibrio profundi]|uniref:glycine zipper family protein n=1 Tax=Vibrio profundi TaxID=1774960 RepID=UPI0037356102
MKKLTSRFVLTFSLSALLISPSFASSSVVSVKDEIYGIVFSDHNGDKDALNAAIQECQVLAQSVAQPVADSGKPVNGSGARGAAKGAAAGAAVGAISGNSGSDGAKIGAAIGLVGGRLGKNAEQNAQQTHSVQQQQQVMRNCMVERNFNALN